MQNVNTVFPRFFVVNEVTYLRFAISPVDGIHTVYPEQCCQLSLKYKMRKLEEANKN